ncbi:ATP-dependent DNA ligase [miscellaneous Crenarchaeota group-15 archaeon DG-45]|uniref:DNA ligase n=1 Tax=miscellaneous Crenarchaeota group-15 archaeon DG-45 TaxID=1685127 RepID=A0A0M0BR02_9ARCH|nr:MAG: ATP-dependent DNA ligase [miscellaneous Crenarchaeota group-15 archaeon DG-45]
MLYATLVETYERLEATSKRLEMTDILADLLRSAEPEELEKVIYLTQGKIHPDWKGEPEIGIAEKMAIETISRATGLGREEVEALMAETGDVGFAAERALKGKRLGRLGGRRLTVSDIYGALDKMARESGKGSAGRKMERLVSLMADASPLESRYLARTVVGTLRLGVGDMTILDALAQAFTDSAENRDILERAYNITSDLGHVARTLAESGLEAVSEASVVVGKPIRMMLAQRLSTPEEIVDKLGGLCSAEYKLDGERFQIHKEGGGIQIFSRRLENITHMYPDAVEMARAHVKAGEAIIEGEAVAIDPETDEMRPFQTLMQRRRKYRIREMMEKFPVAVHLFECLYADGDDLTLHPYPERRGRLREIVEEADRLRLVRARETPAPEELEGFFEEAVADGCEGLVVKSTADESIYRAGARSWLWVKLKRSYQSKMVEPVDLVAVGALHGRGRRAGSYGALLAAAYDPEEDVFRTVCKVGSGFTDEDLARLPGMLEGYRREGRHPRVDALMEADVWLSPGLVIEVLGDEITLSPIHTCAFGRFREASGLAIRFPRFTGRWREDKAPEDATQVDEIADMYNAQLKTISQ